MQPRFQYVLAALLVANLAAEFVPRPAQADGNAQTNGVPGRIPYTGRLELDGVPYNGEVEIRFSLFDGPGDTAADWSGDYSISVFNGTFSVLLGDDSSALANLINNADAFELGMTLLSVGGVDLETPVALAGRQQLLPVPYAMHSNEAADFTVNRDLTVARSVDITGTSRLRGAVTADSSFAASGAISGASVSTTGAINAATSLTAGTSLTAASADINGAASAHSLTLDGPLNFISGSGSSWTIRNGSTDAMAIETDGDVQFARSILVPRGLSVAGATSVASTPLSDGSIASTDSDDSTYFGLGSFTCPDNGVMRGVQTARQNFTIDLPPGFPDITIGVWVVRPICAPGN